MKEGIDTISAKHLRKGVLPIRACTGSIHDFPDTYLARNIVDYFDEKILLEDPDGKKWLTVDYHGSELWFSKAKIKNGGKHSYVISPIDGRNKLSHKYANCTGVVAVGVDKKTGKEISFLSHQDPVYFLEEKERGEKFGQDLKRALQRLLRRSHKNTVDIVVFGGNMVFEKDDCREYRKSIEFLDDVIYSATKMHPVVISGPKKFFGPETAAFNTEKRQLILMRRDQQKGMIEPPIYRADNVANEEHIQVGWKTS